MAKKETYRYTQGEWKYIKDVCGHKLIVNETETDTIMQLSGYAWHEKDNTPFYDATTPTAISDEEAEANAKLIAAAPELLEVLKGFIHSVEHEGVIHGRVVDAVKNAKVAIKKAAEL